VFSQCDLSFDLDIKNSSLDQIESIPNKNLEDLMKEKPIPKEQFDKIQKFKDKLVQKEISDKTPQVNKETSPPKEQIKRFSEQMAEEFIEKLKNDNFRFGFQVDSMKRVDFGIG
jgi:hypothetical protein